MARAIEFYCDHSVATGDVDGHEPRISVIDKRRHFDLCEGKESRGVRVWFVGFVWLILTHVVLKANIS
jgi:hypothetical protein